MEDMYYWSAMMFTQKVIVKEINSFDMSKIKFTVVLFFLCESKSYLQNESRQSINTIYPPDIILIRYIKT